MEEHFYITKFVLCKRNYFDINKKYTFDQILFIPGASCTFVNLTCLADKNLSKICINLVQRLTCILFLQLALNYLGGVYV